MNIHEAQILARSLLLKHGLTGWTFEFDHARRRFGRCNYTRRIISLSRHLTYLNRLDDVRDTILHEIAHALAPGAKHGPRWRGVCRQIGARPERCFSESEVQTPPRRPTSLQIGCPACGWWVDRHRRSRRKLICKRCRNPVVWAEKMVVAPDLISRSQ